MSKIDKKKLPSRHTSLGPDRAPHRSFYYAMGETEQDVAKPFVGVVSTWNEAAPCNTALMRQAQSVKKGIKGWRIFKILAIINDENNFTSLISALFFELKIGFKNSKYQSQ